MVGHRLASRYRLQFLQVCFLFATYAQEKEPIYIVGLYPLTGPWPTGKAILSASQMAVHQINNNESILADYELILISADSACNGGIGINALFDELYDSSTTKLMVLGPGCSSVAEPIAEALHHWNLLQISYSAESPALSQKDRYPTFFRVCLSGVVVNELRVAFMNKFGWKKVATLDQRADSFALVLADFRKSIEGRDIEIITSETIADDPKPQLTYIKSLGSRIIFGTFYEPFARKVFCSAWQIGMYGPKYVWLIPGWYQENWWRVRNPEENIGCTIQQMDEIVMGTFTVNPIDLFYGNMKGTSASGMTAEEYIRELSIFTGEEDVERTFGFGDGAYGFDTVWTAALVLHEADRQLRLQGKRIADFKYNDTATADFLIKLMNEIDFQGITGPVQFATSGDRQGLVSLSQNQNGTYIQVAVCNLALPEGQQLQFSQDFPIIWKDGKPPVDSVTEVEELQVVSFAVFVLVAFFAGLGILLASAFMIFNILYRNVRIIKMSSPRLNNLILIGGVLVYLAVIFGGIDLGLVSDQQMTNMCKVYTWLFVLGFSISFGGLFMKTWRVHRIITTKSVIPKRISDVNLLLKVGVLALINGGILMTWEVLDPLVISRERKKSSDDSTDDIIVVPVYINCQSSWYVYWMGALLLTNGILLIFGAFLSWETRQITIPALNDSKQIGTSIYIVAVSAVLTLPVTIAIDSPTVMYLFNGIIVLASATLVLCLLFLPKIKSRNEVQPIRTFAAPEQSKHASEAGSSDPKVQRENGLVRSGNDQLQVPTNGETDVGVEYTDSSVTTTTNKGTNTILSFSKYPNFSRNRTKKHQSMKESPS